MMPSSRANDPSNPPSRSARRRLDGRRKIDFWREIKAGECAEHEDVAVREIDEPQNAIDHRVAERDERENGAERQTVDELLEKFGQG